MTQDEFIEMAMQAGFEGLNKWRENYPQETQRWCQRMEAFAKLVAEREREACAKFCETHAVWVGRGKRGFFEYSKEEFATGGIHQGMDYAAAIRARGQA